MRSKEDAAHAAERRLVTARGRDFSNAAGPHAEASGLFDHAQKAIVDTE